MAGLTNLSPVISVELKRREDIMSTAGIFIGSRRSKYWELAACTSRQQAREKDGSKEIRSIRKASPATAWCFCFQKQISSPSAVRASSCKETFCKFNCIHKARAIWLDWYMLGEIRRLFIALSAKGQKKTGKNKCACRRHTRISASLMVFKKARASFEGCVCTSGHP